MTPSGKKVFFENQNYSQEKLKLIENGVYISKYFSKEPSSFLRFGSVCRMVELKGQQFLLEAMKQVESRLSVDHNSEIPAFELHFFGTGPLEETLKKQASLLAFPDQYIFHGNIFDRDLIYSNIDILIVSSETEGLSLVIMEAMARNISVIATDVGGNPTLVIPGETGELVSYGDSDEMAETILSYFDNREKTETLGKKAREFIENNYSLERTFTGFENLYLN